MGKIQAFDVGPDGRLIPCDDPIQPWVPKPKKEFAITKCDCCKREYQRVSGEYAVNISRQWPTPWQTKLSVHLCENCAEVLIESVWSACHFEPKTSRIWDTRNRKELGLE